jgi:hypothetical protein
MMRASPAPRSSSLAWLLLLCLLAIRLPSLVEPAGGDQALYAYEGQRLLAGDVPYRDTWDQKPPAIAYVYAALLSVWPHESVVAGADIAAAAGVAWLLVLVGRRRFSENAGFAAAGVFLLFGNPSLQRLSGLYVRSQCETFLALAVTAALLLLAAPVRRRWHLLLAGVSLAVACWLKYNAAAYGLPVALAAWAWRPDREGSHREVFTDLLWIGAGFVLVVAAGLGHFAAHGALHDLRLATIDYNLRYSGETYAGAGAAIAYLIQFPLKRAGLEMLWFLGGLGAILLAWLARANRSTLVVLGWLAAAVLSIAINGGRDLPQYFVQAGPALALAAAAGIGSLAPSPRWVRYSVVAIIALGLWRVGDEPGATVRLGGLPQAVSSIRWDVAYARGRIDRTTYLGAFVGVQKYDALEIEDLSRYIRDTTSPSDPIYVFGFSGGSVCWKSGRVSASRFFWSFPVISEFAAGEPGYGSAGLLADLGRRPPAVVALQKEQWHSRDFFMNTAPLRGWLEAGYVLDHETPAFAVWRRKS